MLWITENNHVVALPDMALDLASDDTHVRTSRIMERQAQTLQILAALRRNPMRPYHNNRIVLGFLFNLNSRLTLVVTDLPHPLSLHTLHHLPVVDERPIRVDGALTLSFGGKVAGKVVNLMPYGAFIELEPGVEGLVHVSELSWTKRINKPSEVLKAGEDIEAVVLGINQDEQKISLGTRQLESNPWDLAQDKYKVGTKVTGKIRNLTSYGAFMGLEEGLDAMIHVSDISWTRKINHPSEVLKKGLEVEAQVLEVDQENQRISVGIKQLAEDPWDKIDDLYKIGDLVEGKVSKLASFGAFVGLEHDIDGLVHISQVSEERVEKIKDVLDVGEEVTARVIKIDRADRRIGLSIKAANYSQEQLKEEEAVLDALKPGEDLVALQHAFDNFGDEEEESGAANVEEAAPAVEEAKVEEAGASAESDEAPVEAKAEAPAEEEAKDDQTKSDE